MAFVETAASAWGTDGKGLQYWVLFETRATLKTGPIWSAFAKLLAEELLCLARFYNICGLEQGYSDTPVVRSAKVCLWFYTVESKKLILFIVLSALWAKLL